MLWRLILGAALTALAKTAVAIPQPDCGLMPLPYVAPLHYVVYNASQDSSVRNHTQVAYKALVNSESRFFERYSPRISFVENRDQFVRFNLEANKTAAYTVMVILGSQKPRSVQIEKNNISFVLVLAKEYIKFSKLKAIESRSNGPYYVTAMDHAFRRGTRLLAENDRKVTEITPDHILRALIALGRN